MLKNNNKIGKKIQILCIQIMVNVVKWQNV